MGFQSCIRLLLVYRILRMGSADRAPFFVVIERHGCAAVKKRLLLDRHDLVSGWVAAKTGYLPGGKYWAVGLIESDGFTQRLVAGCVFDNWRGHDITGHIACDAPVTRPFLHAIHDLPYRVLGVRRITATVRADNAASMEFLRRIGFKHEGTIRAGHTDGSDRLIFGQLKENAKWLVSR